MILTGPKLSPIKSSFKASALKSSRLIESGLGGVEIVWIQGSAGQDGDITDLSGYAFPSPQSNKIVRSYYSYDPIEFGGNATWTLHVSGNTLTFDELDGGGAAVPTLQAPLPGVSWNPRAARYHSGPEMYIERWNIRLHGPISGALVQYAAQDFDVYWESSEGGFDDATMWTDVVPLSVTDVTIANGSYSDFSATDAPDTGEMSVAIFWTGKSTADF